MQLFFYKAVNTLGVIEEGMRQAVDEHSLVLALQSEGYLPIRVTATNARSFLGLSLSRKRAQLSVKDVVLFTSELAILLESGLPLDRSLTVLINLVEDNEPLTNFINRVLDKVKSGSSLTDALERRKSGARPPSKIISKFYLNMIRAGEASGSLGEVLTRLSAYLESSQELKSTVATALIYPAILLVMSVLSLLVMLIFVVPQFTEMFENAGQALPLSTQIVVGLAEMLRSYWWALIIICFAAYYYQRAQLANPISRKIWHGRFLTIPLFGNIILNKETANFTRTLGTLLTNGVSLLVALAIARETLDNLVLVDVITEVEDQVRQGKNLSTVLLEKNALPKMAVQMIKTGEETGRLEEMLLRVATIYDKQLKTSIQRLLAFLEPVLILSLGLMIAGIIVSILLAILSVNDLAF
jgi:general secretion pathway protein F